MSGECCLSFVLFGHFNLVIARESIYKGEENVGSDIINQCINILQ